MQEFVESNVRVRVSFACVNRKTQQLGLGLTQTPITVPVNTLLNCRVSVVACVLLLCGKSLLFWQSVERQGRPEVLGQNINVTYFDVVFIVVWCLLYMSLSQPLTVVHCT